MKKPIQPIQQCMLCGGDASKRNHRAFCPGHWPEADPSPGIAVDPPPPVAVAAIVPPPPIEPAAAIVPPPNAEPYTNAGKGIVLQNNTTAKRVAELFDERAYWESKELNAIVGWQFSQAIYSLRRKGMKIITLRIGPKAYAYQRVAS